MQSCVLPDFFQLVYIRWKANSAANVSTMDSQLEAVRQDIRDVKDKKVEVKQKAAAAENAHNVDRNLL